MLWIVLTTILSLMPFAFISVCFLLDARSKRRMYKIFSLISITTAAVFLGSLFLTPEFSNKFSEWLSSLATIFFTTQLFCGSLVLLAVIIRTIHRKLNPPTTFSPERRKVLRWAFMYPLISFAAAVYGNRFERLNDVKNFYDIPIKNLPPELENFKIAQISDVHLGAYFSLERLEKLL